MVIELFLFCVNVRGSSSPKVQFRDWPRVDVLIQRCLWLKEMSCPVPLHGAYITECRVMDPGGINRRESHYLDDQASLISSCGWASYRCTGHGKMERQRQVKHRSRR